MSFSFVINAPRQGGDSSVRDGGKIVSNRTEKETRGGEKGGIEVIKISRGEEEEERRREGKRKPDQKRSSGDRSQRKKEENDARRRRKIGQLYT